MSDIRETLTNFTKNVTKTSGDLLKTTKLSMAVSSEQTALKALYHEIGKKVHEIYQYGGTLGKFFDEKYLELEACERKINELKEQIAQIKGVRECSKCGKTVERVSEFCPKCGVRVTGGPDDLAEAPTQKQTPPAEKPSPTPAPTSTPAPPPPAPEATTKNCRVCGATNDAGTKFCLSCGRIAD